MKQKVLKYLMSLSGNLDGEFRNITDGPVTLYSSCFVLMCHHYLGTFNNFTNAYLRNWGDYILSHQSDDGLFVGPEITVGEKNSDAHSREHLSWHLTCHVLPALDILHRKPLKKLSFMDRYLEPAGLNSWLEERNWNEVWLEGNNLLFMGQLLTYLSEVYKNHKAKQMLLLLFDWLDQRVDKNTGLWGTNLSSDNYSAAYGGYHQLLLYYYWNRPVLYKEQLIDTVLSLQHFDGGFSRSWGGGSCEDVDCIDILVNLYKMSDYRSEEIENTLFKAAYAVLRRQTKEGGFVYKTNEEFYHMGMELTYAPPDTANIFSTWFGIHSLALICEIVNIPKLNSINFQFNSTCSMGWHKKWDKIAKPISTLTYIKSKIQNAAINSYFFSKKIKRSSPALTKFYNLIKH